jgi:hypothetical protein
LFGNPKGRDILEDLDVDGRIIVKGTLEKLSERYRLVSSGP